MKKLENFSSKDYILTKIGWYYYIEGLTQQKIAELMGLSRITVNKMLEEARAKQLIQFNIPLFYYRKLQLANQLKEKYDLEDVIVIPASENDDINKSLGKAAAFYVKEFLSTNSYINVGYGDTLHHFITTLAAISNSPTQIISLTGGVNNYLPLLSNSSFNISLNLIPAPLFMNNEKTAEQILSERSIQEVLDLSNLATFTITGIGELSDNSTLVRTGMLSPFEVKKIKMQGAVGDILMHFIDKNGQLIESDFEKRLISTSFERLKSFNNNIAVAGGEHKVIAIDAAMKTKLFNRLITDESTAEELLKGGVQFD